jgi:hypothetical protein
MARIVDSVADCERAQKAVRDDAPCWRFSESDFVQRNKESRMAFAFPKRYEPDVEEQMRAFEQTLSEKDQRRFAALEAARLGHGGIEYIAKVLGCSTKTIERGIRELAQLPDDPAAGRVRRPGGGRKKESSLSRSLSGT